MNSGGFFKMNRKIFESDIWENPNEFRLFFYLIAHARWKDEPMEKGGVKIEKGQFLRSYRNIRDDLEYLENNAVKKYSLSQIKRMIDSLVEQDRVKIKTTRLGTLFSIVNYSKYQDSCENTEETWNEDGTQLERSWNNKKKEKKEKKDNINNNKHSPAEKKPDIPYQKIVDYLNQKTGSEYKHTTKKTRRLIRARWNEGFKFKDFITVIDKKCDEWLNDKEMVKYLRPVTLFGTKFESYLNQLSTKSSNEGRMGKAAARYQKAIEDEMEDDDEKEWDS